MRFLPIIFVFFVTFLNTTIEQSRRKQRGQDYQTLCSKRGMRAAAAEQTDQ